MPNAQNPITEYDGSTPHLTTTHVLPSGPNAIHELTIVVCDARDRESVKQTLITMVEYAMDRWVAVHGAGVS